MKMIQVKLANNQYDIHIGKGILNHAGELIRQVYSGRTAVVVSDETVWELYGKRLSVALQNSGIYSHVLVLPAGEQTKQINSLSYLYDKLVDLQIKRSDLIIAFGGGVIGDLTGFCAATYMRGVDYVQIPTTLLAQVDASVGGKTAVNLTGGKNLVGAFWQPVMVIEDTELLNTLDDRQFAGGMAEVIKYAAIKSTSLFDKLDALNTRNDVSEIMEEIVYECCDIKRAIVEADEHDKNERMALNFGHTFGHAIEMLGKYESYIHGEAVAIGMVMAAKFGIYLKVSAGDVAERIKNMAVKFGLPVQCPYSLQQMAEPMMHDKKNISDKIQFILLENIGHNKIYSIAADELNDLLTRRASEWMN